MQETSEQPQQRFCTNCGAEIRQGTSFCVSCGASLNPEDFGSDQPHSYSPPPKPSRALTDTLRETLLGWSRRFSEARSGSGGTAMNQLPNKAINWFRDLSSTPKLVIAGLVLLLILTVLSPLAFVVAALLLMVSIIALIIRLTKRGSVKGWGIVAVASLVSLFVFGGISNALYGFGGSTSDYEVVFEAPARGERGSSLGLIYVAASSLDEEQLEATANDMVSATRDYDAALVTVYDGDEAIFKNGEGLRSLDTRELYPGDVYQIWIAHTSAGERIADVKARVGQYVIEREPGPGNPGSKNKR